MTEISLTVNDRRVTASVEPRLNLADYLREHLFLTGTHLGCEQGVCGACTVLVDGAPTRSCIALAVACDGSTVRTIEGFEGDATMDSLSEAFSRHHALQCGYCTPGMLITSRDVVIRLGEVDERTIREELSGNLCRCTGYMGIVAAVREVAAGRRPEPARATEVARASSELPIRPVKEPLHKVLATPAAAQTGQGEGWTEIRQTIQIEAAPDEIWAAFKDVRRVASCLPGAEIESIEGSRVSGRMRVKLGPMRASFAGEATLSYDEAAHSGMVQGIGRDQRSGTQTRGELRYKIKGTTGDSSEVEVAMRYRMTGALAQFSRLGLVQDVAARLAEIFAQNLAASIRGKPVTAARAPQLDVARLFLAIVARRLRALFGWPTKR